MADMVSACSLRDLKGENQVLFKIPEPIVGGMLMETKNVNEFPELSLMEGGPGDALMKRLRLIRPEFGAASARTAISLAALTWLPLLVFSSIEGLALGGARIPFLYDISAHARFLVAVPILVLAEIPIGRRLREVAKHFLEAGLVREEEQKAFRKLCRRHCAVSRLAARGTGTARFGLRLSLHRPVKGFLAK